MSFCIPAWLGLFPWATHIIGYIMEIHRIYSHDQSNTEKSTYQGGHCSTPRDRVSSRKATISDCRFLEFFQYIVQANHHWLSYTDDDCSSEWRLDDGFLGSPEKFHGHRHISIDIFSDWGDIPKNIYIYIYYIIIYWWWKNHETSCDVSWFTMAWWGSSPENRDKFHHVSRDATSVAAEKPWFQIY